VALGQSQPLPSDGEIGGEGATKSGAQRVAGTAAAMLSAVVTSSCGRPIVSAVQRKSPRPTLRSRGLPGRRSLTPAGLRKNLRGLLRWRHVAVPHRRATAPSQRASGSAGRRCGQSASPGREEEHPIGPIRSHRSAISLKGTLPGFLSRSNKKGNGVRGAT
jgi:hypothetical protein